MLSNPTAASTDAKFSMPGTYTFRVTVSDGLLSSSADVVVSVMNVPVLTLLVSKSGEVLKGSTTSIKESSDDAQVKKLDLYIDQNITATVNSSSLTYRWDLRNVSGTHVVTGRAYNSNNDIVATTSITVFVE